MDITPERFELANRLFSDALNQPREQRDEYVTRNCGGDVSLRESVLLLLSKFEGLGDFLERPAGALLSGTAFSPGIVLAERFRIEALLGKGGMGEVYRARDLKLGDTIALKVIRAEWRSDPGMLARFHDEIRLARRISSDHICKLFDLFTTVEEDGSETPFFTMEYLEGEPLSGMLAREGPIENGRLLGIARGIAAGLDHAHREGIIHRDLKPANIVVVPRPDGRLRAVITDFGLAKLLDTQSPSVTQAGMLVGSPDYMAPEQFLDEVLTPASDIFALGVILYEMTAGVLPFPRETVVRSAMRRLTSGPAPLCEYAPGAPKHWTRILRRAMDRNPAERHASAQELVRELMGRPSAVQLAFGRIAAVRLPRRSVLAASGGVILVSCFAGLFRYYQRALPAAPVIMLMPIVSPTSPEAARSLDVQIEKGLTQSAHVRTLSREEILRAWGLMGNITPFPAVPEPRTVREIALRRGANCVLGGDLGRVGSEWVLTLRMELMGNSASHPQEEFSSHFYATGDTGLLGTAAKAVDWVRSTAGEPAAELSARSRPAEEVTTRSWEALQEYTAAREAWGARPSDQQWPPDQREGAEAHLERALELDSDFAIAASLLADIQVASHQVDDGLRNYQRAAQLISKRNLTDRESLLIWGLFALDTGQFGVAERVFSRYALEYPKEGLPLFHKARAVENQGHIEAALHLLDMAVEKEPGSYSFLMNRAIRYLMLGRLVEAGRDLERGAAMNAGDWTDQLRGAVAFARFDREGVWRSLERMRTSGSVAYRSKAYAFEACFRAEQGRLRESEDLLQQGLQFDLENRMPIPVQVAKRRLLAQVFLRRGDRRQAAALAKRILDEPVGICLVLEVGAILAQAGDLDAAERCLPEHLPKIPPARIPQSLSQHVPKELMEWPIYWRRVLRLWAELALARGNARIAFELLRGSPPGEVVQEWPAALIRASIASGEREIAAKHLNLLFSNPAAYWVPSDFSGPGFMRLAIAQAKDLGIPERNWAQLAKFLG